MTKEGGRTHDGVGARVLGPLFECVYAVGPWGVFIDKMLADRLCVHPFAEPGGSDGVESDVCVNARGVVFRLGDLSVRCDGGINGGLPNLLPKYFGSIEGGESGSADLMCCCYPFVQTFYHQRTDWVYETYHGASRDWMLRTKKKPGRRLLAKGTARK